MSVPVELDPGAEAELDRLEKTQRWELLERVEDAIDALADDPVQRAAGSARSGAAGSASLSEAATTTG